jgi:SAM-dependent methyltransferase
VSELCSKLDIPEITASEFRNINRKSWAKNSAQWQSFESKSSDRDFLYSRLAARVLPRVPSRGQVVDFACGTGQFLAELAERCPEAVFTGVDLFNQLALPLLSENVVFQKLDVETEVLERSDFDVALCVLSAFEFADLNGFFRCAASALQPGSALFVVVLEPVREYQRLLMQKWGQPYLKLFRLNGRLAMSSSFVHDGQASNHPYQRILYSLFDYVEAAQKADFALAGMERIHQYDLSEDPTVPAYLVLEFTRTAVVDPSD